MKPLDTHSNELDFLEDSILKELAASFPGSLKQAIGELEDSNIDMTRAITIQTFILMGLGFSHFGLLDFDLLERDFLGILLQTISNSDSPDDFRSIFGAALGQYLLEQIEMGGTTIEVNLENEQIEITRLIPLILEAREQEMKNLVLPVSNQEVNLRPLWLTEYGFRTLRAMQVKTWSMGLRDPIFCDIDIVLTNLGYPLQTVDANIPKYVTVISDSLRDFILSDFSIRPVSHNDRVLDIIRTYPDLSLKEIADLAGIPVAQVKRFVKKLRGFE